MLDNAAPMENVLKLKTVMAEGCYRAHVVNSFNPSRPNVDKSTQTCI